MILDSPSEKGDALHEEVMNEARTPDESIRVDSDGMPLVPQPSHFMDDPLNWPQALKWAVLLQVAVLAALGPFNTAVVNPDLVVLAEQYNISSVTASYQSTAGICAQGVAPLIWVPFSNVYGRRPVLLITALITVIGTWGSGYAKTWTDLLVARIFSGLGSGAAMAVGTAVVNDVWFMHEKGTKMGVWTVILQNGAHIAPVIGGFLNVAKGVSWTFYLPAIVHAVVLVIVFFGLPETLFSRSEESLARHQERTHMQMLFRLNQNRLHNRKVRPVDFVRPFMMFKYPNVYLPVLCYTMSFVYGSITPSVTIATLFTKIYNFNTPAIGMCLGLPLLVGSMAGEMCSGRVSDIFLRRYAKCHNWYEKPEARIPASLFAAIICPGGLIIYGVTLQYKTAWIGPVIGMAMGSFGLQLTATVAYTYCSDVYKPQSAEIGVCFNMGRQFYAFPMGFYALPFGEAVGYDWAWTTLALITFVTYGGMVALLFKGEEWRLRMGQPKFHQDI